MKYLSTLAAVMFQLMSSQVHALESANVVTSWYGPGLQGNPMAYGGTFDMNDPTVAAHKTLPPGTRILLTNPKTGDMHEVTVQDHGPNKSDRDLDISKAAAKELGFKPGTNQDAGVLTLYGRITYCPTEECSL